MSRLTPSLLSSCRDTETPFLKLRHHILATSVATLFTVSSSAPVHAADIVKASNTNALNTAISWVGGVLPGAGDVAVWDSTVSVPNSSQLGGDLTLQGIRISNVGGPRNTTAAVVIANTSSANTLTIGSGGIDMSAALQALGIQSKVALTANQTWNIANASTHNAPFALNHNEDLAFLAQVANTSMNMGGFTVTKTGTGVAMLSSGWNVTNGAFIVNEGVLHLQGGGNRVTTINNTVSFTVNNGALLRFAAQSGAGSLSLQNNAPVTLNTGSTFESFLNQNNALNLTGNITVAGSTTWNVSGGGHSSAFATLSGNLLGSGDILYRNTATNTNGGMRFTGDNSGYSGTITINGASNNRYLRLSGPNAGSAAASWIVAAANTLQVDGQTVSLGRIEGAGIITNSHATNPATINVSAGTFTGTVSNGAAPLSVTKVGPGTLELLGGIAYTGATTVSEGTLLLGTDPTANTNITVADGAAFGVKASQFPSTLTAASLTVGTSTGGSVVFDIGTFGNPVVPGITTPLFTPTAPTKLRVLGASIAPGTISLIDYSGSIGGLGFGGLSLVLPPRVTGTLVDNSGNTSVDVNITSKDTPKWTGGTNGAWDIDDGTGTGTSNWKEIISGNTTRYIESATGNDVVLFDDTASGATTVNLTAALNPTGVTVSNSSLNYTFTGTGKLTGSTGLLKTGTGTLVIANTGVNDYTGTTTIDGGTVQIGDGVTPGAGNFGTNSVDILSGTLVLNRPDDFTMPNALVASGGLTKNTSNTATISGRTFLFGPVTLNAGTLKMTGGGDLAGPISGAGSLSVAGGTLALSGGDANTFTGTVNVSAGVLQLTKTPGMNAVSDNISVSGSGQILSTIGNQIPDTATITYSADGPLSTVGADTIANAVLPPVAEGAAGTGQLVAHTGFVISDTLTLGGRVFSVASAHSATVNRVTMTGGIVRIAANSGASTLDVGTGGITASGGEIQVGHGTGAFDAVLNLGGNITTTGNLEITRGGFTGAQKREINLGAANRTFNIGAGTTTTVRPDIAGEGGLIKEGGGTLNLLGLNPYLGPTTINSGTLLTSTTHSGTSGITVADNATLQIQQAFAESSMLLPALTVGSSVGGQIAIDILEFGNPTIAPLNVTSLTANGTTTLTVIGKTTPGTFPLVDYEGTIGGAGFPSFSLKLPVRVAGSLVQNTANTSLDVTILGVDTPKWVGNVNADWDIDDGTGTGTANWKGTFSAAATKYLQGAGGTDGVIFDDSAAGNTTVNVTTTLTPVSVTVNNTTRDYEFTGPGKLSGGAELTKQGTGTLTIKTNNDFTGEIAIEAGTVNIGGGTDAGTLGTGPLLHEGTLILNRLSNFTLGNTISGTGSIIKKSATNDVTLGGANSGFDGSVLVEEGRLSVTNVLGLGIGSKTTTVNNGAAIYFLTGTTTSTIFNPFSLAGPGAFGETTGALRVGANNLTFGGAITLAADASIGVDSGQTATIGSVVGGPGAFTKTGLGTLVLGGFEPNTYTSLTTVTEGILRLNKPDGMSALLGNAIVNGGNLSWSQPNQVADTANITVTSGAVNTGNRADTLANLTINDSTQISTFSGLDITGTLTVTAGIHDAVNSSGSTRAEKVALTNTNIRLGANSGPSTLHIGAGGLSMTDATIQYGSAGNAAQIGLVNLGGNFTGSGNNVFDINSGNPISQLDLGDATRLFEIISGVTSVESVIQSATPTAGVIKSGNGSLALFGNNTYTGDTVIQAGTLDLRGSLAGSANILLKSGAVFDVSSTSGGFRLGLSQTLKGNGTVTGNSIIDGILAPGEGLGTLQFTGDLTLAGTASYELQKSGFSLSSDLASVSGLLTLGGTLNVAASGGLLTNGDVFNLFDAASFAGSFAALNLPALDTGLFWDTSKLAVDGTLAVVPEPGSALLIACGAALIGMRRRRSASGIRA